MPVLFCTRAGGAARVGSQMCTPQLPRSIPSSNVLDEIASVPVSLQTLKPVADRANPKVGIGALAFSPDNYFLATRNGQWPQACTRPLAVSLGAQAFRAEKKPGIRLPRVLRPPWCWDSVPTEASGGAGLVWQSSSRSTAGLVLFGEEQGPDSRTAEGPF